MKTSVSNSEVNSSNVVRAISLAIVLLLIVPFVTLAQSGKTDFSGTWTFNESKSDLGDNGRRYGSGDIVVKQDASQLSVKRNFTNRDGEASSYTSEYSFDGKETTNSFGRGESKSTASWSPDGKSLTINTKMSFNGEERTSTDVWTLKDPKTLTIASARQGRDGGEMKTTRAYDKK